jgi:hypothetical protein
MPDEIDGGSAKSLKGAYKLIRTVYPVEVSEKIEYLNRDKWKRDIVAYARRVGFKAESLKGSDVPFWAYAKKGGGASLDTWTQERMMEIVHSSEGGLRAIDGLGNKQDEEQLAYDMALEVLEHGGNVWGFKHGVERAAVIAVRDEIKKRLWDEMDFLKCPYTRLREWACIDADTYKNYKSKYCSA